MIDAETEDCYASILKKLKSAATPVLTNDIWIAALAFQNGYRLFTRDRHFEAVQGLILVTR